MSILIEGATIVSMDPERGSEPFQGNILIEGSASPPSARLAPTLRPNASSPGRANW